MAGEHGQLTTSEGIHIAYQWSYADASARTSASGFSAADVGKEARQLDDDSKWMLTATTPTWVQTGGGSGGGAFVRADGTVAGATDAAQDFGANGILVDLIKPSVGSTVIFGDATPGGILSLTGKSGVSNTLSIDNQATTPKITLLSAGNRTLYIENSGAGTFGLYVEGPVSVGTTSTSAQLHVDQSSATGAQPVLLLDQADDSEEMIEFTGTVGVGNAIEAVGAKTLTTTHFIKITITGVGTRYIPAGTIA